jgi:ribonucleoside-diphosphate reductase alpha chain
MGFADMLIQLGIPYDAEQALHLAGEVMQFIAEHADATSQQLAQERGVFPNWNRSVYAASGRRLRNATRTSIAPTGTIGIIAGTSAGIEPLFALAYRREHVLGDQTLLEFNPLFLQYIQQDSDQPEELVRQLEQHGNLASVTGISEEVKRLFRTALEIPSQVHLRIQAAFQKHVDNAVSKTINLPEGATPAEIHDVYQQAWELGLKGVTVFRYGSRGDQVLNLGVSESAAEREHFVQCDPGACRL